MKTAELIRRLQEVDPSGELEVSHVSGVDVEPAYYDGACVAYEVDAEGCIERAKVCGNGFKVCIDITRLQLLATSHPEVPIEFDSDAVRQSWEPKIAGWRVESAQIERDLELGYFSNHVWKRLRDEAWFDANREFLRYQEHYNQIRADVQAFFDANIRRDAPLNYRRPDGTSCSYVDARNEEWYRTIRVEMHEGRVLLEWHCREMAGRGAGD